MYLLKTFITVSAFTCGAEACVAATALHIPSSNNQLTIRIDAIPEPKKNCIEIKHASLSPSLPFYYLYFLKMPFRSAWLSPNWR